MLEWIRSWFFKTLKPDIAPARPSISEPAQKLLFYPLALIGKAKFRGEGKYRKRYPEGAIVHFTAGSTAESAYSHLAKMNFPCFMITRSGEVWQDCPLDTWGNHAGTSNWPGLGTHVSRFLVGIEMDSAGYLKPDGDGYKSWFGKRYTRADVRVGETTKDRLGGAYHKYTDLQERALIDLLVWLKKNNPDVFDLDLVLGHDEVSGMKGIGTWRKNDPGHALSMSMPELRAHLKTLV
jgi:N-acetyl-anhydromuramyl-L-alanine amidase AmpD